MRIPFHLFALVPALALLAACGGGGSSEAPEASGPWPPQPTGAVDHQLAERGEDLYRAKGCAACHRIGEGRLVGPDLEGLADRRSYGWSMGMITNPDSMLRTDSIARRLLGEYFTPMSDQGVTAEQARAIWEYLREEDEDEEDAGE